MTKTYLIDGLDLNRWTILSGSSYRANVGPERTRITVPNRHGEVSTGLARFTPPTITIELAPHGPGLSVADLEDLNDELSTLVSRSSVVLRRSIDGVDIEAVAELVGFSWEDGAPEWGRMARATAQFDLPGVFWRDTSPTTVSLSAGVSTPAELGGTAPITDAVVQWPAQAGLLTLTDETTGTGIVIDSDGSTPVTVDLSTLRAWGAATWTPSGRTLDAAVSYPGPGLLQVWPVQSADSRAPRLRASHTCTIRARRAWL